MKIRFSIRDLLWLALAFALAIAWVLDHRKLAATALVLSADLQTARRHMELMREDRDFFKEKMAQIHSDYRRLEMGYIPRPPTTK